MTTFNDLDFGPSHAWLRTRIGQVAGSAQIEGSHALVWPRGRTLEEQPVDLYVAPWQGLGGNPANTRASLMLLLRQLEELCGNSELQPVYIGWTTTAFGGAFSAADPHDGWYVVTLAQPNYRKYVVTGGVVTVPLTASLVAPASPVSLALGWAGALLPTTYTGGTPPAGYVLGAYPIGSTAPASSSAPPARTGAEGVVPVSVAIPSSAPQPLPFVRPPTVAGLYTGGCRVLDTVVAGGNAVPTNGTFLNASWVQVYGTQHDFTGDAVVTNGLLLLLFQQGVQGVSVYLWNTKLATPAWQLQGMVRYFDAAVNAGTVREINLERVGLEQVKVRITASTSAGSWSRQVWRLRRAHYDASIEHWALTEALSSGLNLSWVSLANAAKIGWTESGVQDIAVSAPVNVSAGTAAFGYSAVMSQAANSPLIGFLYQNPPAQQGAGQSTTTFGFGDSTSLAQGTYRLYGIFAVPFTTAPNLQAEGESGSLGTGWSSVADAAASNGNTAKAASGTASGNADLFGTAWQPQPQNAGGADVWFRVRVTSAAGSAAEMTLGLWDATAGAFVGNGSTTFRANQAGTSYGWLKANTSLMVIPVGHNVQFRAVTAATLGTDWFIDEAFLAPKTSAASGNLGSGDWPADLWEQFSFPLTLSWVPG